MTQMNLSTKQKQTHRQENTLVVAKGRNKDVDIENGVEDTGWGGGSWGKVRVTSTYIHYQM